MEEQTRDFKGIFIPKDIWFDTRLNMLEKGILMEIDSLDGINGCYCSNQHLAEFCGCSETKVSTAISKLIELGYIYLESFNGRQRVLKSRLSKFERQDLKNLNAEFKNLKERNIIKINNKDIIKEKEEKESNINELLDTIENRRLKDTLKDFIKMRKAIKKPLTTRGLQLLFSNLNKISVDIETQIKVLEQSILNSWQGVYPLKQQTIKESGKSFMEILEAL